jgi:MerR family transcriptional regulator, mercuric resistance operon regulatory protein
MLHFNSKFRTMVRNQGETFMRRDLTIGKLAERAGVNVGTSRYYQRRGLLDEPKKPLGGYRHYPPDTAKRVRFIKRAQALGFTLEEIAGLLRLEAASACAETRELAAHKLALIQEKLAELTAMRKGLAALVSECDKGGKRPCPIIQMLVTD